MTVRGGAAWVASLAALGFVLWVILSAEGAQAPRAIDDKSGEAASGRPSGAGRATNEQAGGSVARRESLVPIASATGGRAASRVVVRGRVESADGAPLASACVYVVPRLEHFLRPSWHLNFEQEDPAACNATSGAGGQFQVMVEGRGAYKIVAVLDRHLRCEVEVQVPRERKRVDGIVVRFPRFLTIRGRATALPASQGERFVCAAIYDREGGSAENQAGRLHFATARAGLAQDGSFLLRLPMTGRAVRPYYSVAVFEEDKSWRAFKRNFRRRLTSIARARGGASGVHLQGLTAQNR